jgi:hypothetical protein
MKKLFTVLVASILLGGCTVKDLFVKAPAGLEIATIPTATVFINGESKGETPYSDKNLKPGNYTVKLVPTGSTTLPSYETKLVLVSKASTIISRTFTESEIDSSGYTLQLQEDPSGLTFLSVISDPDTINVTIDDKPSGFTPLSKLPSTPGAHTLLVTSPGYIEQSLSVNTVKGYNLIINFKLAGQTINLMPTVVSTPSATLTPTPSSIASPSPSSRSTGVLENGDTTPKPYVLIGETGTGWLRIRKEASGTSDELGKANTGEKLKYLGESTDLGWHKIEFEGSVGWVSGKYVTIVK